MPKAMDIGITHIMGSHIAAMHLVHHPTDRMHSRTGCEVIGRVTVGIVIGYQESGVENLHSIKSVVREWCSISLRMVRKKLIIVGDRRLHASSNHQIYSTLFLKAKKLAAKLSNEYI